MRFEHPHLLWLLLVVPPALALFFWWRERARQRLLTRFVDARLLSALTVGLSPARRKVRFLLLVLAVACLIVTLARPQRGFDLEEVSQNGLDVVVAVDTSRSMLATDIAPNRLARAKLAVRELMQRARADRLGLVAFAGSAFLECPLTIDDTAFQQSVQALDVNTIPRGGTALAEAINTARTAFKEQGNQKALVLFTDGEDNDTGALEAAQAAAKAGLKIFTIGIGSADGTLITVKDAAGNSDYVRDDQGNVVKSHLNEPLLRQIAEATGGFYLPLRGAGVIDALYDRGLAPLPKAEGKEKLVRRYHEQFQWPLAAAILLLAAEMLLPERKRLKTSNIEHRTSNIQSSAVAVLVGLILLPAAGNASPSSALRAYRTGNFTNALQQFTQSAQVRTNDLRLVFNAGDAAYRATNFDLAQNLFQQAALSPDLKLQARAFYNLGNAQFRLGQLGDDLDAMEELWKSAAQSYDRAHTMDTNDVDAAFNAAFTKQCLAQVAQLRELARKAKEAADDATRRAEYHRALLLMLEQTQKNPAAKPFEDYVKRLKDIDDIATPHQP